MLYELKAALQATSTFSDTGFSVKNKEYAYSDIINVSVVGAATVLTNAVIQITLKGDKIINCAYDKKHKVEGDIVVEYLKFIVTQQAREKIANEVGDLTTAKGLYQFCADNGYGKGFNESWGVQHFQILVDALMAGEKIIFPFIGLHNYVSMTKHDSNFAYAVTNKRIIMGQKKMIGQIFQSVNWENVNDITFKSGLALGIITIDTFKETFNVAVEKTAAQLVCDRIHEVFEEVKNPTKVEDNHIVEPSGDPYEALKKMKELLDLGIVTQDEFETKKKELLGL